MNQPKLFPGLPRRPELCISDLLDDTSSTLPVWFVEDVNALFESQEIFEIVQGIGQLARFADVTSKVHIPPYWRTHWLDCVLYELDDVCSTFRSWRAHERGKYCALQRTLQYKRDALEASAAASRLIGGPRLEFELLRADRELSVIFSEKAIEFYGETKVEDRRLRFTKQHFPEAWWVQK